MRHARQSTNQEAWQTNGYGKSLGKSMLTNIDSDFDGAAPIDQEGRNMWCIAVPSLDHGFLTYGPGTPNTRRFELLYWSAEQVRRGCAAAARLSRQDEQAVVQALSQSLTAKGGRVRSC
ncbi:hypothetical protein BC940DRAFT_343371 [Gongronella butleri]|nr:hypothetical protein BC940DRAFT_343371 [Gongronella butleri]